jgi:Zn-dependent M28 family amino/carboxypeptidase
MLLLLLAFLFVGLVGAGLMIVIDMPGESYRGPFQPLSAEESQIRNKLRSHVEVLAGRIGERNLWHHDALQEAAAYIEGSWTELGYELERQEYAVSGKPVRNIAVELTGTVDPDEILVIGAHYDSVLGSPAANDNGTGVAALLELTRLLRGTAPRRSVRFVAFVNEEAPFYYTPQMGSWVYAARAHARGDNIKAMLSLETIGCYSDEPGSQKYPFPFSYFYPDRGNFIGFVGNLASRRLVRAAIKAFRTHTAFPSEGVAAPGWITGIGWSDHWSFWREGYPAIMITDTAPFRYAHYHAPTDTPDKIDYERTARVVHGLARVVAELGDR